MIIAGIFFLLMGLAALIRPNFIVSIFGVSETNPEFRNEIRAVYGGYGLLAGIGLIICKLYFIKLQTGFAFAFALSLAGMAVGRIISLKIEKTNKVPIIFIVLELVLSAVIIVDVLR